MKFSELDDFVNNQMEPQPGKNYQQIVITTLIQNGGTVTVAELKEQVLKYHPESNFNLNHRSIEIITQPVRRRGEVLYDGETIASFVGTNRLTIEILDYDTYTIEEKAKLIVDCILRIPEKKEYLEDSIEYARDMLQHMPELKTDKEEVLKKYGNMFKLQNIDNLTPEKYQEFLSYENNHHWTSLSRDGGNKIKDMPKLKQTLKILVDESIPIEDRIKQMRSEKLLGKATFTPILLVASSLQHAVVNDIITGFPGAFDKLGLITEKQSKKLEEWEFILLAQKMVEYFAKKYQFDLWQIDWVWYDIVHKRDLGNPPKYWLIKPGTDNVQKEEFLKESFIEIGYLDLFLPRYFNRDGEKSPNYTKFREIAKKILKDAKKSDTPQNLNNYGTRFNWFMEMEKGDVVVLWDGSSNVFAKGKVTGRYQYNSDHRHQRAVVWEEVKDKQIPKESQIGPTKPAIFPLKDPQNNPEAVSPLYKWLFAECFQSSTMSSPPTSADYQEDLALLEWEKNLILYGPPGTGKTYHANKIAESLVASNTTSSTSFTFDPSKNYFMINGPWSSLGFSLSQKPFLWATKSDDPSSKGVWDKLQPGDIVFVSNNTKDPGPDFSDKVILGIGICVKKFKGTEPYWPDEKKRGTIIYDLRFELKLFTPHPSKAILFNSIKGLPYTKGFNAIANEKNIKQLLNQISNNWTFQKPLIENIEKITFHQSFSYEEFIEGIKPKVVEDKKTKQRFIDYSVEPGIFKKFCKLAEDDKQNKYVMIIDEINRGNISKIFGELITVIEKDKRGTTVTLPYSGDSDFHVPKNVYVIGTMNTADRSIAKIDTALSRRFGRREIMPDSGVLDSKVVKGINLTELLDKLNGKIKVNHRDRQIGHSYLMDGNSAIDNISDLRLAFLYDIIPLLKELTFDAEEELKEIIGNHFIDYKTKNIKEKMTDDEFEKEMKSFLNSDPKENEPEEKGGDETDAEET